MTATNIDEILQRHDGAKRDSLIPVLQEIQEANGFLSTDAIKQVGQRLNLPASKVYGVATFYNQFRFQAPGKFEIQICRGTACHVKGSAKVLAALERALGVEAGQTTRDGLFSLVVVACIGACGLAPVICIDGEFYAGVSPEDIPGILDTYRERATDDSRND